MKTQPKALYLLNFISMWECFSYYGMRVLLVLFMVHELKQSDAQAFSLYALYTTLVELGGVVGGVAADRYLGLKKAIGIGGLTIMLGHVCMALPDSPYSFLIGLGLIIAGTCLFRSNVPALLSQFYDENDPRKEAGYTLYYTGINLGGFLASILCGVVGEMYGWHAGFGLAAIGMMIGNIALWMGSQMLKEKGEIKKSSPYSSGIGMLAMLALAPCLALALFYHEKMMLFIPFVAVGLMIYAFQKFKKSSSSGLKQFKRLCLYGVFLILFYGCEEQLGSTLILFAERHVDRDTTFGLIPASSLVTFNPFTILIVGVFLSKLIGKVRLHSLTKMGIGFAFLGSAFLVLYASSFLASETGVIALVYPILSIVLISLGELLVGPTVYAVASETISKSMQGLVMGIVTLGFALANWFSGVLSQMMIMTEPESSLVVYREGFWLIGCWTILLSLILLTIAQRRGTYVFN